MARRKSKKKVKRRRGKQKLGFSSALKQRVKGIFPHQEVIVAPPNDGIKMSEVLGKFIEPYLDYADTEEAYRKLLTVAVAAWNVTLLPEKERLSRLDELLLTLPEDVREVGRGVIEDLMARKERFFSQYRKMIVDFEVADIGREWHLSVVSMPDPV